MQERNLTIYFTSDLHSYIYPTDYRGQEEKDLGLFKCASQFQKDGNTLVIDGGDLLQGSPLGGLLPRYGRQCGAVCPDHEPLRIRLCDARQP